MMPGITPADENISLGRCPRLKCTGPLALTFTVIVAYLSELLHLCGGDNKNKQNAGGVSESQFISPIGMCGTAGCGVGLSWSTRWIAFILPDSRWE